jgi:NlpC/P60 family putative phage cell wall peptidase
LNTAEQRAAVVAEANSWIFTPYHHNARLKGVGVDCVWLLLEVYKTIGVVPHDFSPGNYSREWYFHRDEEIYLGGVQKYAHRIEAEHVEPGDVAVYKIGRCVSHGAIIVDEHLLIHANRKARQVELSMRHTSELDEHFHSYWSPFP